MCRSRVRAAARLFNGRAFLALLVLLVAQNGFAATCWSDDNLAALEQTQLNSVVYVWSPRMALSIVGADDVAQQARTAGLVFVPIVDGRVPESEWQSALHAYSLTSLGGGTSLQTSQSACTVRLTALDAYQHFPSVFLVRAGTLEPDKWTGAMNAGTWGKAFSAALFADASRSKAPIASSSSTARQQTQYSPPVQEVPVRELSAVVTSPSDSSCVAANQFISLPAELAGRGTDQAVALGAYERISPDGRFILRSYSGKDLSAVSVMELPAPVPSQVNQAATVLAITQTPLSNEAFPVQGSWRYIVDTNGKHYSFSDLLKRQKQALPLFQGGMSGFYAAAAEVSTTYPAKSTGAIQIRSLSWPNATGDSDSAGDGMLTARTLLVAPDQHRLLADSGTVNLCASRAGVDGVLYSLPMISVDGSQFSALPQRPVNHVATMRVFGFGADGKQCTAQQQFASPAGKVTFGFTATPPLNAGDAAPADLVYEYRSQVWWYHSASSTALNLAPVEDPPANPNEPYRKKIMASAFPGLTRDGRVIYAATWQLCKGLACSDEAGYVASDPYQSNAYQQQRGKAQTLKEQANKPPACVTTADVRRERAAFADFHGILFR